MALSQTVDYMELGDLHPDPQNPRLRSEDRGSLSDDQLLVFIAATFEPVVIAESIALHGYFGSEPLVVTQEGDAWVVLEGNRRLTALMGLARADLRSQFDEADRWNKIAAKCEIELTKSLPVMVADERKDADAVVGFRHISGVEEWKPLQRAQYIAYLVDDRDKSFLEVADTVGLDEDVVRMLYRNQSVIEKARDLGREEIASAAEHRFGTFTSALNRTGIREFIGVNVVGDVDEKVEQLDDAKIDSLEELSSWLYGETKVIEDTRELSQLAEILKASDALKELRNSRDLASAFALTPGPPKRLLKQLAVAVGHLKAVANSVALIKGQARAEELADELDDLATQVVEGVRDE